MPTQQSEPQTDLREALQKALEEGARQTVTGRRVARCLQRLGQPALKKGFDDEGSAQ